MPLHERVIQPINVSRSTLPLPHGDIKPLVKNIASSSGQGVAANAASAANINIVNELECVTNGTLANLIRQLSSLSRQAEELLTGVFEEASKILNRTVLLQQRIDGLAVKVETLDQLNEVSITLRNPTNHPETFASDMLYNQQVLSKSQLPSSIAELYKNCDEPPPLNKLDPYREDGKDSLKFYTDPTYFFELWKNDMLKSQQQFQSSNQNSHHHRQSQQSMVSSRTMHNPKRSSQNSNNNQQSSMMPQTQQIIYVHREQAQAQPQQMPQTTSQPQLVKHNYPHQIQPAQQANGVDPIIQHHQNLHHHQQQQSHHQQSPIRQQNLQYDSIANSKSSQVQAPQLSVDPYLENGMSNLNIGPPPPPALSPLPPAIESSPDPPPALSPLPPQVAPPQPPPAAPSPPPPPPPPPSAPPAPALPQSSKPSNQQVFVPPPVTAAQLQLKQSQLKKAVPVARDPRSDLLAAIKQGISLRKVAESKKVEAEKQQGMGDTVAAILARRIAVQDSDYEDNDDDDDDNEWDESSNH